MLPKDPVILLSYINTQLRDFYASFEDFCDDKDEDPEEIMKTLNSAGFTYDREKNRFV